MKNYLFFDTASTTKCCEPAAEYLVKYSVEEFGNPSSVHCFGQSSAKAIQDARSFFADAFKVDPEQVIFTGSGTEANNLAILGTTFDLQRTASQNPSESETFAPHVLASSVEHAAVRNTMLSLMDYGVQVGFIPMSTAERIEPEKIESLLSPSLHLVSIQTLNNIVGSQFDVIALAEWIKNRFPKVLFHTDAIQAFGKIPVADSRSQVDMVSISGHKIYGPKGIGALIVLNKKLLKNNKIRPLIWGGEQEGGLRSGTQSTGLIAAFHKAAEIALSGQEENFQKIKKLRDQLEKTLTQRHLLGPSKAPLRWNSPAQASPYIINLSVPGYPAAAFAKLLEERGCLISVGSACSSSKSTADPVLAAMAFPKEVQTSAFRISLSTDLTQSDIETLAQALQDSVLHMQRLAGKAPRH